MSIFGNRGRGSNREVSRHGTMFVGAVQNVVGLKTFLQGTLGFYDLTIAQQGVLQAVDSLTAHRTWQLPDASGTIALLSDLAGAGLTAEDVEDTVATLLQNGTGITWSYNDALNQLTPTVTITQYTDELAQDAVGGILTNGGGLTWTYDDSAGTISAVVAIASTSVTDFTEAAQDAVASLIQNGTGISWSYNDGADTLTPTISLASFSTSDLAEGSNLYYTDERVDDRASVLIQNGTGISWSYNDGAGTLTPTISLASFSTTNLSEGTNLYFTDERVDDRVAVLLQNSTGISWSYNDGANTLTPALGATLVALDGALTAAGKIPYATALDTLGELDFKDEDDMASNSATAVPSQQSVKAYVDAAAGTYTDESAQDAVATLIQNGTGISWSYNDGANTLTPTISLAAFSTTNLSEGSNLYYTDERNDDRTAVLLQNSTGITWSYNDGANTLTPALDATLVALAGLATGASKIPYSTGTDTFSQLDFKDEDDMSSNSATALPSQQSVKAYVDAQVASGGIAYSSTISAGSVGTGTTFDLTSISGAYNALRLILIGVSSGSASQAIRIQPGVANTFTLGLVHGSYNQGSGATTWASLENSDSFGEMEAQAAADLSYFELIIWDYAATDRRKRFEMVGLCDSSSIEAVTANGYINTTSAINALRTSLSGAGSFDAGTYILEGLFG